MAKIGERIRTARIEKGLTQDELARRLGYKTRSTVNKVETGTNDVYQRNIVRYAEALGVSVAYLMGWEEEEVDKDAMIAECIQQLSAEGKEKVLAYANDLLCSGRYSK